eukprot:CAMPEP_0196656638 /NCGR_PEP_ID=MMETSP1086-20130531/19046_1 /TAXON_ID=77921 /ORGANISM="Cyanoptyche  gloeocystis , Strain SAG4.97" /LENGTH=370 /DNA_ID=CAMNT_0041989475 /DNA_START=185 /DNA_END=1297 /DNA_ORIENTATION=-
MKCLEFLFQDDLGDGDGDGVHGVAKQTVKKNKLGKMDDENRDHRHQVNEGNRAQPSFQLTPAKLHQIWQHDDFRSRSPDTLDRMARMCRSLQDYPGKPAAEPIPWEYWLPEDEPKLGWTPYPRRDKGKKKYVRKSIQFAQASYPARIRLLPCDHNVCGNCMKFADKCSECDHEIVRFRILDEFHPRSNPPERLVQLRNLGIFWPYVDQEARRANLDYILSELLHDLDESDTEKPATGLWEWFCVLKLYGVLLEYPFISADFKMGVVSSVKTIRDRMTDDDAERWRVSNIIVPIETRKVTPEGETVMHGPPRHLSRRPPEPEDPGQHTNPRDFRFMEGSPLEEEIMEAEIRERKAMLGDRCGLTPVRKRCC